MKPMLPRGPLDDYAPRTEAEAEFVSELEARVGLLDVWPHETPDGRPWLIISRTFGGDTIRLDFDDAGMRGGWSPANLNRDDGVPAIQANIDLGPPDGIDIARADRCLAELAELAADWFEANERRWADRGRLR